MDKVAVAILNLQGEKTGNVEVDHSKVVEKTIFALRGFGEFRVNWGYVPMGKSSMRVFEDCLHMRRKRCWRLELDV